MFLIKKNLICLTLLLTRLKTWKMKKMSGGQLGPVLVV